MRLFITGIFLLAIFLLDSCYYDKADKLYPYAVCDTASMKYSTNIKPLFDQYCVSCHNNNGTANGLVKLDTYSDAVASISNSRLYNSVNWANPSGSTKNMPQSGKLDDCSVAKISAWIRQGAPQ